MSMVSVQENLASLNLTYSKLLGIFGEWTKKKDLFVDVKLCM